MKYLYGPIKSRRLGNSLGINLTLPKTCSFDCVYCQLGKTGELTTSRSEYIKIKDILEELKTWVEDNRQAINGIDYFTVSGSGEPTLNNGISQLIKEIKAVPGARVAVITNACLLHDPAIRGELLQADLIVPSLDAVTDSIFRKIDRPHPDIKIEDIIQGLIALRREFKGKIWVEVMLLKGINDDIRHIRKLKDVLEIINPDKIQLNSPVRSTSETDIASVEKPKLKKIKLILGEKAEII